MPYRLDIPGWMSEADLCAIEALAAQVPSGGLVVEAGSFVGRSTYAWCKSVAPGVEVVAIDTFDWLPEFGAHGMDGEPYAMPGDAAALFDHYTQDCDNLRKIVGLFPAAYPAACKSDIAFIDASHEFPWVAFDIGYCLATVKPGGLLCGDDYSSSFPDVVCSVDSAAKMLNRKVERLGSKIWALRMPLQCEPHDKSIAP